MTPLVIKLGGSHAGSSLLRPWIDAIAPPSSSAFAPDPAPPPSSPRKRGPSGLSAAPGEAQFAATTSIVLVPGGGPFADTVRAMQPAIGYNDHAAHDMALMAMAQFGRALAALSPHFTYCDDLPQTHAAAANEQIPVWSPWPGLRDAPDIPQSWDVTSDSLALWLARMLNSPSVLLVKHRPAPDIPLHQLAQEGIIDPAFPDFAAHYHGAIYIAGPDDTPRGPIDPHHPPGRRITR